MEGNLAAALARRAETYGWRPRPLFHAGEVTYTHGAVHDAAALAAGVLHAAGVRAGHRVLIALPDSIGFAAALFGTLRLGALAVLTGPEQAAPEHGYVLADSEPTVVVCGAELADRFPDVHVLTPDDLTDEPSCVPEPASLPLGAPAYVQYTSGTTGPPKGVVHRHTDAKAYFQALGLGALGVAPGDVLFSISKACYPYGLGNSIFFPMFCGASSILWPEPANLAGAVEMARRHRPTLLFTVPSFYTRLVAQGERSAFASLRAAASAGEPLHPSLAERVAEFLGCPVLDGLGSTEVGHTFISNTITRRRRGTLGVVLDPYETQVRTRGGGAAAPGERGVLHVRGPSVMIEYLGKPEQTDDVVDPVGWLDTGDLVHVDEEGFVHHHGRVIDQEQVGGVAVSPLEVERVLGLHPAVAEVAVVGRAGAREGGLHAFVVLAAGFPPSAQVQTALLELARARLAAVKVPRTITFMTELPRTPAGKVRRATLRRDGG